MHSIKSIEILNLRLQCKIKSDLLTFFLLKFSFDFSSIFTFFYPKIKKKISTKKKSNLRMFP